MGERSELQEGNYEGALINSSSLSVKTVLGKGMSNLFQYAVQTP